MIKSAVIKLNDSESDYLLFLNQHKAFRQIIESLMLFLPEKKKYNEILKLIEEMNEAGEDADRTSLQQYGYEAYRGTRRRREGY